VQFAVFGLQAIDTTGIVGQKHKPFRHGRRREAIADPVEGPNQDRSGHVAASAGIDRSKPTVVFADPWSV
jgi:hypothetical protein